MTTAFVLSGGASLGAVQAGMVEALMGAGIAPDLIVGSSVGALNGAWLAGHPGVEGAQALRELWLSVRRRDIFPFSPLRVVGGVVGRCNYTVSALHLARWLAERAPFRLLEHARVPLHVMATDMLSGKPVMLSRGETIPALLASAAIPGIFPPVEIDGRLLVDGGLVANAPVSQAVDLGADVVYLLPTAGGSAGRRPRSALGVSWQSVSHLLGQAANSVTQPNVARCTLHVIPAPPSMGVSPMDFRHSEELMAAGRASAEAWLAERQPVLA